LFFITRAKIAAPGETRPKDTWESLNFIIDRTVASKLGLYLVMAEQSDKSRPCTWALALDIGQDNASLPSTAGSELALDLR
jgi:hypothetical protein